MKRFLLFLFLLNSFYAFAQNEWAPKGATWYYGFTDWQTNGYLKISYIGDTIINSVTCKILEKKVFQYNLLSQFDTLTLNHEYTYADKDRVYIFRFNNFYTIYDFSAEIGDSILLAGTNQFTSSGCDSIGLIRVDSSGTMIINGKYLRYISVSPFSNSKWGWAGRIVEKIGPIYCYQKNMEPYNYLFPNKLDYCGMFMDQMHEGGFLRCYSDQSGFAYSQSGVSPVCDYITTDIKQLIENKIKIFPNPFSSLLTLQYAAVPENHTSLVVLNAIGSIVYHQENLELNQSIDLKSLQPGFYLVRILENNHLIFSAKIFKI